MNSFRASTLSASFAVPVLGFILAITGCSGQASTGADTAETAQSQQSLAQSSSASSQAVRIGEGGGFRHGPRGPEALLFAALHEPINLSADQKTAIEGAIASLRADREAQANRPAPDRAPMMALAKAVRAGKIDTTAIAAAAPAAPPVNGTTDIDQHRVAAANALATLHSTLNADQRRALVDAVTKRMGEHDGKGPGGEHDQAGEGGRGGREFGPMGGLLKDLNLTDAQRDAIRTKFEAMRASEGGGTDREAMKKTFESFKAERQAQLQTFTADSFDANAFVAPPPGEKALDHRPGDAKAHFERMANELAVITSVLDQNQREQLATRLEQGPPEHRGFKTAPSPSKN